ncbi:sucrase-isomaltase, intestinal-like [Branchiostoma lanceolatum]|uniref:sucrase-isomaltase, intestinal-like n=1 Tax=Branchiostoma lanceolatum TaxID=7740 RepID=UPI003455F12B
MPAEESSPGKPVEDPRREKGGFSSLRWRVVLVVACVVVAALLVIIVPTAVVLTRTDRLDPVCPAMDERERVDCHPEGKAARDRCEARGCCWSPAATQGPPSCFYPTNHGYEVDGAVVKTASGYRARLRRLKSPPTPYSADVDTLEVVVEMQEDHRLHVKILDPAETRYEILDPAEARYEILDPAKARYEVLKPQILDPAEARYEVPEAALRVPRPGKAADNPMYDVTFTHRPFSFKVTRRSTGATIFDTSVGKLTFGDQFLSVSTRLASSNLYGLGEHVHRRYRHDLNWKTWPIFSRGASPKGNFDNLYGHHPFYMCLEDSDGNANGVFLLNSNAMASPEVTLQPPVTTVKSQIRDDILDVERVAIPTVTYRVIGGVLDFYMFLGPSPENVVQQYTEMIGRSIMPAYWALGFQLSRWNYTDINKLRRVVQRTRDTGIPYDVQYGDIDYMEDTKDFTYDADLFQGLPDLVQNLHDHGQKYIIILDPAIGNTNRRDGSPYLPYESGVQDDVFVKNADGVTDLIGEVCAMRRVFPDKRGIIITRANFVGTGQYSGHWLGDNKSAWEDMEWSITGMLEFGLFGIPYIGADICGFLLDTTEQLCQRWMQLGAFYPYSRNHNHNDFIDQDPAVFSQNMIDSSRDVMMTRYTLLPYLYTLFYHAHVAGTTVVRPLLHEFPTDSNTWDVDKQFLWGSGLLISPVLTPDTTTVDAYFPDTPWYDYFTGQEVEGEYRGQTVTLDAPLNKINVHVRGGTILPTQQPANTTVYSRKNPMGLLVAMDDSSAASGTLFWDDGESIDSVERQDYVFVNFSASSTELLCEVVNVPLGGPTAGHWADLRYGTVSVYGIALGTGTPTVRAGPSSGPLQTVATSRVQYDRDNQVLLLTDLNDMNLAITSSLRVTWG